MTYHDIKESKTTNGLISPCNITTSLFGWFLTKTTDINECNINMQLFEGWGKSAVWTRFGWCLLNWHMTGSTVKHCNWWWHHCWQMGVSLCCWIWSTLTLKPPGRAPGLEGSFFLVAKSSNYIIMWCTAALMTPRGWEGPQIKFCLGPPNGLVRLCV